MQVRLGGTLHLSGGKTAGRVVAIHRYPLKSVAGQRLTTVELTADGLDGDRVWACLDGDGRIGSAKHPRRWQRLLDVSARFDHPMRAVTVTVPGHPSAPAGTPRADAALSAWLGRPVRLIHTVPARAALLRWWPDEPGMIPTWATGARSGQDATAPFGNPAPGGRFYDYGTVHIVTTVALDLLGQQHGTTVDPIRFRPNLLLDLWTEPAPGQRLRLGPDAIIEIGIPTPRCVIPSIAHGDTPADPTLLRTLARHHRTDVPAYGRATCFGHYATVIRPGTITRTDAVAPE